ncbi:hypothetical protein G9A89_019479 [Geosiphon pyriformis]|nr:hypothetical protein G9A89_019479 [Geosiphon pyriformis]
MNKFDGFWMFTSELDSGHMGSDIAIVMDIFLVKHVCKVSEAGEVNSLIAKTVNESSFIILDGNFNKNGLYKSTSFKRCLDLGLVNSLSENLRGVKKTIDFVLVLSNLVNAVVDYNVVNVSSFVSVGLDSLLDTQLNSLCRQANRNHWKFDFRDADNTNAGMFANEFATAVQLSDLDVIWNFKNFDGVFTRDSSKFHKLELLVFKLVKTSRLVSNFLFLSGSNFDIIRSALAKVRKFYYSFKLLKFRHAEETCIKMAINKKMESFESDKGHTIRSVLECPFHKVVLNYLIVGDELVLEPSLVKFRFCQYWPLEYVFDNAFSGVMCSVGVNKLFGVVSNLLKGKAAVLDMLLVLLNSCLICELILSKILLDRILLACSTFDVLCGDNFLVLRGTMMQSPIFAIGSVVENALEKGRELWVMTDFGLMDGYRAHDSLNQKEMFSPLLWHIFYDSLLCEVKRQTVAILINCKVADSSLLISESPISIVKKGELYYYLEIYLSTEGLSKLSLAKAYSDVWFFANLVFKKAVSNKQFLYLVLAVLFPIVNYRTQFSYVPVSACKNDVIHHLSLYSLKTFEQIQAENKSASVISFTNSVGILGCLFFHQSHNLQILYWHLLYSLQYLVYVKVNSLNNFLVGMVHIFSGSDLSLGGSLTDAFCHQSGTSMSCVLGESTYFKCFLPGLSFLFDFLVVNPLFLVISANLLCSDVGYLSVYMDGSLSGLESVDMKARTAVFFEDIGMNLGVGVSGLMSSTLTELQTIALALECVSSSRLIDLFLNSQAALDACKLELDLVCPDFRNWCWIKCCHIVNIVCHKNLNVNWYKVKDHSGVLGNKCADELARATAFFSWNLLYFINECYFRVGGAAISEIRVEYLIENSLSEGIPAIKLRKKLTKLWFRKATNKTITIESLSLLIATRFEHQVTDLLSNPTPEIVTLESAFNFYINKRIDYLLETLVNIELAREAFYSELIQNTNLPTNHNFASIIMEINKEIEHHTQQRYSITYMSKGKGKLQTPAVTPKRIQPST